MATEKPENPQPVVNLNERVDISQSPIVIQKKQKKSNRGLLLGAIAKLAAGIAL